jgi:uncharacterized OB-fold protein
MYTGLLPDRDDPLTAPYWDAALEGRLVVQRCHSCAYLRWPAAELCPVCLSTESSWVELSGEGTVWSFAVYQRAMHPAFADAVPYTVATIELVEGPHMVGTVLTSTGDADADGELHIGDRVSTVFDRVTPEISIVRWRPAASADPAVRAEAVVSRMPGEPATQAGAAS